MKNVNNPISRRDFLRLAGLSLAGTALVACGASIPAPKPTQSGPVNLVYQDWRTDWFPGLAEEMLAIFHEQHPNIRVFYTPDPDNLEEKMMEEMEAGTAPDVFAGCCSFFPGWAQSGHTLDLRPYVEADIDKATIDDWSQAQYKSFFTADGRQFGLPKYNGGLALFFNKDIFDLAGIPYPESAWTYEEYLDVMKKLTVKENGKTVRWGSMFDPSWERIQIHVNGWGGHFVDPDDHTKCVMASDESLAAMEWLRTRIWDDHVMATFLDVENDETRQAFIKQKIAMVEDGSWALKDILDKAEFRVGVAPFPVGPVRHATLATTDGFGIYAGTKHPDEAWELMKFLISQDYGRAMARAQFLQPARASVIPDWVTYIREEYPEKAKEVNLSAFADGQVNGYAVTAEIFPNMLPAGDLARQAWDKIFVLGQAPVTEMIEVCKQIDLSQKASSTNFPGIANDCNCS